MARLKCFVPADTNDFALEKIRDYTAPEKDWTLVYIAGGRRGGNVILDGISYVAFGADTLQRAIFVLGDAQIWRWVHDRGLGEIYVGDSVYQASDAGNLSILKEIYDEHCREITRCENNNVKKTSETMREINEISMGGVDSDPRFLLDPRVLLKVAAECAAYRGWLHILKWATEMGVQKTLEPSKAVARNLAHPGNLRQDYLLDTVLGVFVDETLVMFEEKVTSPLETIKWLNKNEWPLHVGIFAAATAPRFNPHLELALWLLEREFPFDDTVVRNVFQNIVGKGIDPGESLLKGLLSNRKYGYRLDSGDYLSLMMGKDMDLFVWVLKNSLFNPSAASVPNLVGEALESVVLHSIFCDPPNTSFIDGKTPDNFDFLRFFLNEGKDYVTLDMVAVTIDPNMWSNLFWGLDIQFQRQLKSDVDLVINFLKDVLRDNPMSLRQK